MKYLINCTQLINTYHMIYTIFDRRLLKKYVMSLLNIKKHLTALLNITNIKSEVLFPMKYSEIHPRKH